MYYGQVSPRSNSAIDINYYLENKFGVNLVKTQIRTIDSLSVVVVSLDRKIIHSHIARL
jgi:hypothetical protein